MTKSKLVIVVLFFSLLILGYISYTNKLFPFNRSGSLNCGTGEYVKQCKLGPCCCPIGVLCD